MGKKNEENQFDRLKGFKVRRTDVMFSIENIMQPNMESILKSTMKSHFVFCIMCFLLTFVFYTIDNFYIKDFKSGTFYIILFFFFSFLSGISYFKSIAKFDTENPSPENIIEKNVNYLSFRFNCLLTTALIFFNVLRLNNKLFNIFDWNKINTFDEMFVKFSASIFLIILFSILIVSLSYFIYIPLQFIIVTFIYDFKTKE